MKHPFRPLHFLVAAISAGAWLASAHAEAGDTRHVLAGRTVNVCVDANDWPPFTYLGRAGDVAGYSRAVVAEILGRHQIRYTISRMPWRRCLAELKEGKRFQLTFDMANDAERGKSYLLSTSYYSMTGYYFYSRRRFPNGLPIRNAADLKGYSICGLQGHAYHSLGLAPGDVDQGARDHQALVAKLYAGRCELFLELYESMLGFALLGTPFLDDPNLGYGPIPGQAPYQFSFGISQAYPQAAALKATLDAELAQMQASGKMKALWIETVGAKNAARK